MQILVLMLGRIIDLPIVGVLLGLPGGDVLGSVTGAAGGLLGSLGADLG